MRGDRRAQPAAGPHALVARLGTLRRRVVVPQAVDHVGGRPLPRRDRVDSRDLRHPLAVLLLSLREARLELVLPLLRAPPRLLAEVLLQHDDALAVCADDQQVARHLALASIAARTSPAACSASAVVRAAMRLPARDSLAAGP